MTAAFRSLGKGIDKASDSAAMIAGVMIGVCSLIVTYAVVMRYIFQSPTKWTFETAIYITIWFAFLCVAYGLKEGSHVQVDIIVRRLPDNIRAVTEIWGYAAIFIYSAMFALYAFEMVVTSFTVQETSDLIRAPVWLIKLSLLVGMGLTSLQAFRLLISKCYVFYQEKFLLQAKPVLSLFILLALLAGCLVILKLNPMLGLIALLFVLLGSGVPISFSLGLLSAVGFFLMFGGLRALPGIPVFGYAVWESFEIMALPFFIFVGHIMYRSGMSEELFNFASSWFGHLPGGLAIATLASTAIFAAITGSSVVCAATIGLVAIPALARRKYDSSLAAGVTASGGTLGILIPPSAAFILYGIVTEQSIGRLFMAGIVPGIMLFGLLSLTAFILCKKSGQYEPLPKASWKERAITTKNSLGTIMMPAFILGAIYTGVCTVTESAALAVAYALVFIVVKKGFRLAEMTHIIRESTKTVAMACILLAGAITLSKVVTMLQVTQRLITAVGEAGLGPAAVIIFLMGLLIIMGMFVEGMAMTLIVIPVAAPILSAMGVDLIWFAVLFVINGEIAMLTPPVGLNLYIIQQISGINLEHVIKGSIPFIITLFIGLVIVGLVPEIATWLPSTME